MKSKLLKKLRRRFADTHKEFLGSKDWVCDGVFSTEEGVRCSEYFRKC